MNRKYIISLAIIFVVIFSAVIYLDNKKSNYSFKSSSRAFRGGINANYVIVEYSDFQCPACRLSYFELKKLEDKYKDLIRLEYKHFPLPAHNLAYPAAEASECANDQGKFWEYHDKLFENQESLSLENLSVFASSLGLNMQEFSSCLSSGTNRQIISQDIKDGNQAEIDGTPTFFLNGTKVTNYKDLDAAIDQKIGEDIRNSQKNLNQ